MWSNHLKFSLIFADKEDEEVEEKDEHSSGQHRSLFFYLLGYIQSLSSSLHVYFVYPRLSKGLTLGSVNRKTATNHKNFLVTPRKSKIHISTKIPERMDVIENPIHFEYSWYIINIRHLICTKETFSWYIGKLWKKFQIEKRKPCLKGLELKLVCKIHKSKSLKTFFSIAQCIAFLEKIFGFVVNTLYACFCNLTAYIKNTSTAFTLYRNVSKKNKSSKKSSP